jgi:hypothetical protein
LASFTSAQFSSIDVDLLLAAPALTDEHWADVDLLSGKLELQRPIELQ